MIVEQVSGSAWAGCPNGVESARNHSVVTTLCPPASEAGLSTGKRFTLFNARPPPRQATCPEESPRSGSVVLMATLDRINARMGRGTIHFDRVPAAPALGMRQKPKSPGYVSRWSELRRVT
ncbi:DNA polymerase V subunit UmuC [compost metagenome]